MSTFGNGSISGASVLGSLADGGNQFSVRGKFPLTEAGEISKLTVYIDNQGAGHRACNIRGGVYDDDGDGGQAGTLKGSATVAVSDNQAAGWVDITFSSPISVGAGEWWLCVQGDSNAVGCRLYGTTTGGTMAAAVDAYADGLSNPGAVPFFIDVGLLCIYATYSTGAAGIPPLLLNHLLLGD